MHSRSNLELLGQIVHTMLMRTYEDKDFLELVSSTCYILMYVHVRRVYILQVTHRLGCPSLQECASC
jgi:hypothetical protein